MGIQNRANDSAASSGAAQAGRQVELFFVENDRYPTSLGEAGSSDADNLQYDRSNSADPKTFCITATSGNRSFYISSETKTPTQGGCPGHGQSGVAAITNLATNPRAVSGPGINSNNSATHPLTKDVTVPATPDGITTAAEQRWVSGPNVLLNIYNLDGLGNPSNISRSISAWLRVNAEGYRLRATGNFPAQDLPANTWVRVQTTTPVAGDAWGSVQVQTISGTPAESDRAWITGIMAVEGSQHYSFADGNSPSWVWNGTPGSSSSAGPAL